MPPTTESAQHLHSHVNLFTWFAGSVGTEEQGERNQHSPGWGAFYGAKDVVSSTNKWGMQLLWMQRNLRHANPMQLEDLVQILTEPINCKKEILKQLGKFKYELKLDNITFVTSTLQLCYKEMT